MCWYKVCARVISGTQRESLNAVSVFSSFNWIEMERGAEAGAEAEAGVVDKGVDACPWRDAGCVWACSAGCLVSSSGAGEECQAQQSRAVLTARRAIRLAERPKRPCRVRAGARPDGISQNVCVAAARVENGHAPGFSTWLSSQVFS